MKASRWLLLSVVLLAQLFCIQARGQAPPPTDLDAYVSRAMQVFDVPGLSIAVVKDGKVLLAKGYGLRKIGAPACVDENTLFGIGSNTDVTGLN